MSDVENTRTLRRLRYQSREVSKAFSKTLADERICTICQESIEDPMKAEVSSCSHVFHALCGFEHRKFLFKEAMRDLRIHSDTLGLDSSQLKVSIAKNFFEFEVGRSCPNCRTRHPFAHRMARKTTFKSARYEFPKLIITFSSDDVMRLAALSSV